MTDDDMELQSTLLQLEAAEYRAKAHRLACEVGVVDAYLEADAELAQRTVVLDLQVLAATAAELAALLAKATAAAGEAKERGDKQAVREIYSVAVRTILGIAHCMEQVAVHRAPAGTPQ